jgi:hypothetical protein
LFTKVGTPPSSVAKAKTSIDHLSLFSTQKYIRSAAGMIMRFFLGAASLWGLLLVHAEIYPDGACPIFALLPFTSL